MEQRNQQAIKCLLEDFPSHYHGHRGKQKRLIPLAMHVLNDGINEGEDEVKIGLAAEYAAVICTDGRYDEAKEI